MSSDGEKEKSTEDMVSKIVPPNPIVSRFPTDLENNHQLCANCGKSCENCGEVKRVT